MIHYRTVEIPARTEQREDFRACDLCKEQIKHTRFSADDVTVKAKEGFAYPEGGHADVTAFDLCLRCFRERLVPALLAMGATPRTEEHDW